MGGSLASGILAGATSGGSGDDDSNSKIKDAIKKYKQKASQKKSMKNLKDSPINMPDASDPVSAKRGARKIKKTGLLKAHKGERVLTAKQAKKLASKGLSPADVAKHGKSKKKGRSRKGRSKSR